MIELTEEPKLTALYLRAAAPIRSPRGEELPNVTYVRRGITVDPDRLAEYNLVCGFGVRDELPLTYPHVLGFGAALKLMLTPKFPFPLVGLVHLENTISQERPLRLSDRLTQRVWAQNMRSHPKGRLFDIVTETDAGSERVWREVSTYLHRGERNESAPRAQPVASVEPGHSTARWRLPGDLGRRYAAVSGDRNPIHLHPLAAKVFGFPRAIAHGMWSKARCLAAFEGRLPQRCQVRVEFRKPVLLPSTVEFTEHGDEFALHSTSGKPHLLGKMS